MTISINQYKVIKPLTWLGSLIMGFALFTFVSIYIMKYGITLDEFLFVFSIGATMFIISFIPGLRIKIW